MTMTT